MPRKMIVFAILALWIFSPSLSLPAPGEEKAPPAAAPKERYKVVGDLEAAKKIRPMEIEKFFNYSCGHCYTFLQGEDALTRRFGDSIYLKRTPIFWGKQTPFASMAYYHALNHNKGEKVNRAIFDAHFAHSLDPFDPAVLNQILLEHGLAVTIDGKPWNQSPELQERVRAGMNAAEKLDIHETPTIVINGAIKVMPDHTDGDMDKMLKRVEEIILELSK